MADHETTIVKTALTRAWTDIEPKVLAWIAAGGLLTVITIIIGYVDPTFPIPVWVAPVVTYVGGLIAAYLKRSTVKVPAQATPADLTAINTPTTDLTK